MSKYSLKIVMSRGRIRGQRIHIPITQPQINQQKVSL